MVKALANDGLKNKLLVVRVTEEFKDMLKQCQISITNICVKALRAEAEEQIKNINSSNNATKKVVKRKKVTRKKANGVSFQSKKVGRTKKQASKNRRQSLRKHG